MRNHHKDWVTGNRTLWCRLSNHPPRQLPLRFLHQLFDRRAAPAVGLELACKEPTVEVVLLDQFVVGAALDDLAAGDDQDLVGFLDRAQPVGDCQKLPLAVAEVVGALGEQGMVVMRQLVKSTVSCRAMLIVLRRVGSAISRTSLPSRVTRPLLTS